MGISDIRQSGVLSAQLEISLQKLFPSDSPLYALATVIIRSAYHAAVPSSLYSLNAGRPICLKHSYSSSVRTSIHRHGIRESHHDSCFRLVFHRHHMQALILIGLYVTALLQQFFFRRAPFPLSDDQGNAPLSFPRLRMSSFHLEYRGSRCQPAAPGSYCRLW